MKKGFLLTNPASKTTATSSLTKVTPTTALKSIPSDRFHDVIISFFSGLIKRNPSIIFSSITTTDPSAIVEFLNTYKDQVVPMELLLLRLSQDSYSEIRQVLEYASKQSPDIEDLRDPMHQSDASINFDVFDTNLIGSLDDVDDLLATLPRNITPKSSEYTPSRPFGSRTVTFNQSLLSSPFTPYKQQLKQDSKPQSMSVDNGKKLKQNETDNNLKNGNVIITGYVPQDYE
ncbi:hypothetical protein RclHR1_05210013 [Rhizophagus clarus]|uniref:Uncharacterized protein n=1 Tax=Rhizophagus clarus TaxID=94130 RepID=A0A2Z6RRT8_9GLOM|nr:hypothetical protein RclHR1_05210013 [Rhizophagus clarus]